MESNRELYADDDPEYAGDAAADVGADTAAEVAELVETDPKDVPKDEGDPGQPTHREG